ncbi:single-stranded DNA-binding protein [Paenarthrobacter sp. NPDC089322]|uniref:single-stranded DNA-binding protein n=1 Tax=Paenarthrobacter sp. NPDC089322 TaxID=3155065 RepID=UPI003421AA93
MNDTITVRGFVASEVKSSTTPRGTSTASFRLGTTERRFDRATNTWVDGNTNWYTVQSFRYLAGHVGCSIKKGQRVIVMGRLRLRQWEHEGRIYHVAEIDAESVGHDLMWGSANFTRMNGTGAPLDSAPSGEQAPVQLADSGDWPVGGDEGAPLDDPRTDDGHPDAAETLMVDTATGELMDAAA